MTSCQSNMDTDVCSCSRKQSVCFFQLMFEYLQSRRSRHVSSILTPTHMTSTLHHFMVTSVRPSSFLSDWLSPCCGFLPTDCSSTTDRFHFKSRLIAQQTAATCWFQMCKDTFSHRDIFVLVSISHYPSRPPEGRAVKASPTRSCNHEPADQVSPSLQVIQSLNLSSVLCDVMCLLTEQIIISVQLLQRLNYLLWIQSNTRCKKQQSESRIRMKSWFILWTHETLESSSRTLCVLSEGKQDGDVVWKNTTQTHQITSVLLTTSNSD